MMILSSSQTSFCGRCISTSRRRVGFGTEARERNQFLEQLQLHQTQIIEYDSKDIGFLITLERGHDIELHTLCIAPEYQGRGYFYHLIGAKTMARSKASGGASVIAVASCQWDRNRWRGGCAQACHCSNTVKFRQRYQMRHGELT